MGAGTSLSSPALIRLHLNSLCPCPHPLGIDGDSFRKPENCVRSDVSVGCQELNYIFLWRSDDYSQTLADVPLL